MRGPETAGPYAQRLGDSRVTGAGSGFSRQTDPTELLAVLPFLGLQRQTLAAARGSCLRVRSDGSLCVREGTCLTCLYPQARHLLLLEHVCSS